MRVEPLTGVIGAEVTDIDLAESLADDQVGALEDALLTHLVLFFRDQHLTDRQHCDLAGRFGPLEPFVLAPPVDPLVPEMHELTFEDGSLARGSSVDSWHSDGTFMARPPMGTMLRAVELPPVGGDTCWANMYAAYDALSPAMRAMLDELWAFHDFMKISYTTFDAADDPAAELASVRDRYPVMRHPVVRTHPVTGRKLLYVQRNYTTRIDGLSDRESDRLLRWLIGHVSDPAFQCRFRWSPGAVAFWDNRATQHYGVPDYAGRRAMHRVVIAGDEVR